MASAVLAGAALAAVTSMGSETASAAVPGTTVTAGAAATSAIRSATAPVTFTYGPNGVRNTLDVYSPARATGRFGAALPTVLLVHGGSWIMGSRMTMAPQAKQFAALGYVAISMDYRTATEAAYPAQRDDLRTALHWVRAHATELNVDVDRIVVVGSSAGAEIAASALTLGHGSTLARGLVTLSGPLDKAMVVERAGLAKNAARLASVVTKDLLGCEPAACPKKYAVASPKNHLDAGDVPTLLFTSRDEWVNPKGTYDFHAAALSAGLASDLVVLDGKTHAAGYWDKVWPTIRTWVEGRMDATA